MSSELELRVSKLELLFKQLSDWLDFPQQNQDVWDNQARKPKGCKSKSKNTPGGVIPNDEFFTMKMEIGDDEEEQEMSLENLEDGDGHNNVLNDDDDYSATIDKSEPHSDAFRDESGNISDPEISNEAGEKYEALIVPSEVSKEIPVVVEMERLGPNELQKFGIKAVQKPFVKKRLQCKFCPSKYNHDSSLRRHLIKNHPENKTSKPPGKCPECDKSFRRKRDLEEHIRMHTGERPFKCGKCDFATARERYYKIHLARHEIPGNKSDVSPSLNHGNAKSELNNKLSFQCDYCTREYSGRIGLSLHRNKMHRHEPNFKKQRFDCSFCQKSFKNSKSLEDHTVSHTKEKRYLCSICGNAFSTTYNLREHVQNVHGDPSLKKRRPLKFTCSLCPRMFVGTREMNEHIRRHTGEKPFKCDKCDYSTVAVKNLRTHVKIHK